MALGLLSACAAKDSGPTSLPRAQAYFTAHQADLNQIIALIDACRPGSPVSYFTRVFVEREDKLMRCDRGDPANFEKLMTALKVAGLVSADFVPGPDGTLASVDLAVHYTQPNDSGPTTTFDFYAAPQDAPTPKNGDKDFHNPPHPLTGAPHHWFWAQDKG